MSSLLAVDEALEALEKLDHVTAVETILRSQGITISAQGNDLEVDAPEGALTPEIVRFIRGNKQEILRHYRHRLPCHNEHFLPKHWRDLPPLDGRIKTVCRHCGKFIGYRPVETKRANQDQRTEAAAECKTQTDLELSLM